MGSTIRDHRLEGDTLIDDAVLSTLAILGICIALAFLPGYGLLAHVRSLRPAERLACSGLLSAVICGIAALGCFLMGMPTWPAVVAPLAIGAAAWALAGKRGCDLRLDAGARQVGLFWLLTLAELVGLELVIPTFGGAGWFA